MRRGINRNCDNYEVEMKKFVKCDRLWEKGGCDRDLSSALTERSMIAHGLKHNGA